MTSDNIQNRIKRIKTHLRDNPNDYQAVIDVFRYNDKLSNRLRHERQCATFKHIREHKR